MQSQLNKIFEPEIEVKPTAFELVETESVELFKVSDDEKMAVSQPPEL